MRSLKSIRAILRKDFQSELRTRYALNALFLYAVTSVAIILIALRESEPAPEVFSGMLWTVIFFTAMSGLSRIFVSEEERETTLLLRLIASPAEIFIGKLLYNCSVSLFLSCAVFILFFLVFPAFVVQSFFPCLCVIILGSLGFASTSTIIAAIAAKARARGALYTVLAFSVLTPLLVSVMDATALTVQGADWNEILPQIQILTGYVSVVVGVSVLLFDFIWND